MRTINDAGSIWQRTLAMGAVAAALLACDDKPLAPIDPDAGSPPDDASVSAPEVAVVELRPGGFEIDVELTVALEALAFDDEGAPMDGEVFVFESDDPSVASVSALGVVTALAPGPVTITATADNGVRGSAVGTVRHPNPPPPVLDAIAPAAARAGSGAVQLSLRGAGFSAESQVMWGLEALATTFVSEGELSATIDAARLLAPTRVEVSVLAPTGAESASLVFTVEGDEEVERQVHVSPTEVSLEVGSETTLVARVTLGDVVVGDAPIRWTSSEARIATVGDGGAVHAHEEGTAHIRAWSESAYAEATVTVLPAPVSHVWVSPTSPVLMVGDSLRLHATTVVAGGDEVTDRDVTWSVEHPGIASVGADGLLVALAKGRTRVRAHSEGVSGLAYLEVRALPPPGEPRTFDLRYPALPSTPVVVGEATWYDAEGELQRGDLSLIASSLYIDMQEGVYEQRFEVRVLGQDVHETWVDAGEVRANNLGVLLFSSTEVPGTTFRAWLGALGELHVDQQVGSAPQQTYAYVIR